MRNAVVARDRERAATFRTLKSILGSNYQAIGNFSRTWMYRANCHPTALKQTYDLLRLVGLTERQILRNVTLLGLPERTIWQSYEFLRGTGLSDKAIASDPQLLAIGPM